MQPEGAQISIDGHVAQYQRDRKLYVDYCDRAKQLIEELLEQNSIPFQTVEARTKSVESLREKLGRPGKSYPNGTSDITDLCGLRVITYTLSDVKRVCDLLSSEFFVVPEHTVDKTAELSIAEFGYRSRHFVVKLQPVRTGLPEWKRFSDRFAEIQVRTVLEHAWAAIDHSLRYKRDADVPSRQKRTLYQLSAILELADQQFDVLRSGQIEIAQTVNQQLATNAQAPAVELNGVTYRAYAESAEILSQLASLAREVGFTVSSDTRESTYSDLVQTASLIGIRTIQELNAALGKGADSAKSYLAAQKAAATKIWKVTPTFIALLYLLRFGPTLTTNQLVANGWGAVNASRVLSIAAQFRQV